MTHENTKANMAKMLRAERFPRRRRQTIFEANGGRGLPKRTFTDKMTIGSGNDQIDLCTSVAAIRMATRVVFPTLKVMHAGDIFSGKNVLFLDAINGGSADMPDTLSKAADFATSAQIEMIITGHSTQMTVADLRELLGVQRRFPQRGQGRQTGRDVGRRSRGQVDVPAKYGVCCLSPRASRATSKW